MTRADGKQAQILKQAMGLALQYGYHKVSMDEIARAAGMSRPALYQHFANKAEIFQAIAHAMIDDATSKMAALLNADAPLESRLAKAIGEGVLAMVESVETTPHGLELMELKQELGRPAELFEETMLALFSDAYERDGHSDAEDLARQLLYFLEGMKVRIQDSAERRRLLRVFLKTQLNGARA